MPTPRIDTVQALPGTLSIVVKWRDGGEDTVDMSSIIRRSAPLAHLENPQLFSQVEVIDWGCALGWPGDIGYGADTLLEQVRQRNVRIAG
ncbi:MAG: DUF2442 domain-containing protein [Magnetococcales bacterium]|nr:DUF2442 domain-containing protein [Magnetococcales bacterium]